jgi:hypothetical protein
MFDNFSKYAQDETIYPGSFDFATGKVGYERVEIDLLKAGRIPAAQIYLGKAQKTVVEYDSRKIVVDTLCSWLNITDLNKSKLYRIKVCTEDEYGNLSLPQELTVIPYTSEDLATLSLTIPRIITSPWVVQVDWINGISSVLLDYYALSFSYTDKNGNLQEIKRESVSSFSIQDIETGEHTINIRYKVVPKIENVPILDTLYIERPLSFTLPLLQEYKKNLTSRIVKSQELSMNMQDIIIVWDAVGNDYTLKYTTLRYLDHLSSTPTMKEVRIENGDKQTVIPGAITGDSITVFSTYEPVGGNGVLIDANPVFYTVAQNISLPRADLMDIVFSEGNLAKDVSPLNNSVIYGTIRPETFLNTIYGKWMAKFTQTGNSACYYGIDYSANATVKTAFQKAFSYEVFFMAYNPTATTFSPLSSETAGGSGIEIVNQKIAFWIRINNAWKNISSEITVEPGKYYHAVGTYNKSEEKIVIYVNGEKKGELIVPGDFNLPPAQQWIAIGGDPTSETSIRWSLNGEVGIARLYGKPLSSLEVLLLYKDIVGE